MLDSYTKQVSQHIESSTLDVIAKNKQVPVMLTVAFTLMAKMPLGCLCTKVEKLLYIQRSSWLANLNLHSCLLFH